MVGILVALIFSWLLLYLIEKKNILSLGFTPLIKRLKQFFIGFLITAFLCFSVQYLESFLKSSSWVLNENFTVDLFLKSSWWDLISVLTEELIFRGALLFILIKKLGNRKAIMISAIAFGVYHWFSYRAFGNITAMVFIFIGTGAMGYALALAFSKTESIMLPLGLHLGWNFVHNTIFSKGPLGEMLLISKGGSELSDWISLLNFLTGLVFVPILIIMYVKFFVKTEHIEFTISTE